MGYSSFTCYLRGTRRKLKRRSNCKVLCCDSLCSPCRGVTVYFLTPMDRRRGVGRPPRLVGVGGSEEPVQFVGRRWVQSCWDRCPRPPGVSPDPVDGPHRSSFPVHPGGPSLRTRLGPRASVSPEWVEEGPCRRLFSGTGCPVTVHVGDIGSSNVGCQVGGSESCPEGVESCPCGWESGVVMSRGAIHVRGRYFESRGG